MPNFDQEIEINIGTNDNPTIIKYPTPIEGLGSSSKETLAWLEVAKKAVLSH